MEFIPFDNNYFTHHEGFVTLVSAPADNGEKVYANLSPEKIYKAVYNGTIKADKFVLLYLYDPTQERTSEAFLKEYGVGINNRIKEDIPLFTVYSKEIFDSWKSKLMPKALDSLEKQFSEYENSEPKYSQLKKLAELYNVNNKLPALVVIDGKGKDGYQEIYTSVCFNHCETAKQINDKVCEILSLIENNPNDFTAIKNACSGKIEHNCSNLAELLYEADPNCVSNFFWEIIKKKGESFQDCADAVGINRNTFQKYREREQRIPANYLYGLALHLLMKPDQLDWLYAKCADAAPREYDECLRGKNKLHMHVKNCLEKGMNEVESYDYLESQGIYLNLTKKPRKPNKGLGEERFREYEEELKEWEENNY